MQNEPTENWQDEAHKRLGDFATSKAATTGYFTATADELIDTGEAWVSRDLIAYYNPEAAQPAWRLAMVEIREEELEGLDRAAFRDLVRGKLQVVGDDLLKAWEERDAAG